MFNTFRSDELTGASGRDEDSSTRPADSENQTRSSSLSYDIRIQYFIGFFCLSIIASFCGSSLLVVGKITGFCVLTSISSVLSLLGTCFLCGPLNQIRKMFDSNRWLASLCYIGAIVLTLFAGIVLKSPALAIICVVIQYIAMAWYSLSYIPFARQFIQRTVCSCC